MCVFKNPYFNVKFIFVEEKNTNIPRAEIPSDNVIRLVYIVIYVDVVCFIVVLIITLLLLFLLPAFQALFNYIDLRINLFHSSLLCSYLRLKFVYLKKKKLK